MKKICLMFNHLQYQDGVSRSAIAIANNLTRMQLAEVTLMPLFINDKSSHSLVDCGVKIKPVFGFYFKGFASLIHKLPMCLFSRLVYGQDKYDIEVAFQYGLSLRCVAAHGSSAAKYAWVHTYDEGLRFKSEYEISLLYFKWRGCIWKLYLYCSCERRTNTRCRSENDSFSTQYKRKYY